MKELFNLEKLAGATLSAKCMRCGEPQKVSQYNWQSGRSKCRFCGGGLEIVEAAPKPQPKPKMPPSDLEEYEGMGYEEFHRPPQPSEGDIKANKILNRIMPELRVGSNVGFIENQQGTTYDTQEETTGKVRGFDEKSGRVLVWVEKRENPKMAFPEGQDGKMMAIIPHDIGSYNWI